MCGFPGSSNRQKLRRPEVFLVIAVLYGQCMDETTFDALLDYNSTFTTPSNSDAWCLLVWQNGELPSDFDSRSMNPDSVPPFPWRKLMVPLWDKCTNWRVLQASVHVDNHLRIYTSHIPTEGEPRCWFEYTRRIYRDAQLSRCDELYAGTVLETVRTSLAHWISHRAPNCNGPDWGPALPTGKFLFSTYLGTEGLDHALGSAEEQWRWECQVKLQETIADMDMNEVNLPTSMELILSFILALPGAITYPNIFQENRL